MRSRTTTLVYPHRRERYFIAVMYLFLAVLAASSSLSAATGYTNEISNLQVVNITQTSADIVWDTVHLSTSQVLLCRDMNYQPEVRIPWTVTTGAPPPPPPSPPPKGYAPTNVLAISGQAVGGAGLVNHHTVHVTGLRPYNSFYRFGTYYYYVASVDARGVLSTSPGPVDYVTTALPSFHTLPVNTSAPQSFLIYTYGPTNVFAGSDLYFAAELHQLGGSAFATMTDVVNQTGPNNNSDGIVTGLTPATQQSAGTIGVHLACQENGASDAGDQSRDSHHPGMYGCYTSYSTMPYANFRLRTLASTVPGPYQVTFTYINEDVPTTATYQFNVVAAPAFRATPPSAFPAIPGKANWETQMVALGHKWCDTRNGKSRDDSNAAGSFLTGWGWDADAWFYDGGRVYQQIDDYTANKLGQPNHALWQHCALSILDPYRQYQIHNNAAMSLYNIFPWGMAMNYFRTGATDSRDAVFDLEDNNGGAKYGGWVDWYSVRETSYTNNVRLAAEMMGRTHTPLLDVGISKLLGDMDQIVSGGKVNTVHPFMVGIAMQTLINYYEWKAAKGVVDNRIPVAVKSGLDALWTVWNPNSQSFQYNNTILPRDDSKAFSDLNGLVASAYAWYWSKTGDPTALSRGDTAFQTTLSSPGDYAWSGKQFSQVFQWTFDYVRWRGGEGAASTVFPSLNPYTGPIADTEPPVMGGGAYTKVIVTPTATGATFTWNTYEPATTQVKYGVTSGYGSVSPVNPSLVTGHRVVLAGLLSRTIYHYQVISVDAAGNVAALQDQTFTTTP